MCFICAGYDSDDSVVDHPPILSTELLIVCVRERESEREKKERKEGPEGEGCVCGGGGRERLAHAPLPPKDAPICVHTRTRTSTRARTHTQRAHARANSCAQLGKAALAQFQIQAEVNLLVSPRRKTKLPPSLLPPYAPCSPQHGAHSHCLFQPTFLPSPIPSILLRQLTPPLLPLNLFALLNRYKSLVA
jgi:hypothetical protein